MKPGVEDSSMMVNSLCSPTSIALSSRQTTAAIKCIRYARTNGQHHFSHHTTIASPIYTGNLLPTFVLIVTVTAEPGTTEIARRDTESAYGPEPTRGHTSVGNPYCAVPHKRPLTPAFCDPVHSIKHRMPLFAYRGYRKRHHQRKEEACSQL